LHKALHTNDYMQRIVDRYSDMLFRITWLHLRNKSDAEDIAQDVFFKLVKKQRIFESDEHEKAWLIRVAINLCKDRLKSAWFGKTVVFEENLYNTTPEKQEVLSSVLELPVKYRSIVLLFYYENYTIAEIAEIIGRKETTIGSQLHRARKMLKIKLEEDFANE